MSAEKPSHPFNVDRVKRENQRLWQAIELMKKGVDWTEFDDRIETLSLVEQLIGDGPWETPPIVFPTAVELEHQIQIELMRIRRLDDQTNETEIDVYKCGYLDAYYWIKARIDASGLSNTGEVQTSKLLNQIEEIGMGSLSEDQAKDLVRSLTVERDELKETAKLCRTYMDTNESLNNQIDELRKQAITNVGQIQEALEERDQWKQWAEDARGLIQDLIHEDLRIPYFTKFIKSLTESFPGEGHIVPLSDKDLTILAKALNDPSPPNEALKAAAKLHDSGEEGSNE